MIHKIIRLLYYILFFLTPFIMAPATNELFEFNKMMFIYFVSASVAFLWGITIIKEKKIIFTRTPLDIPILLFLAALSASTIFSIDRHTSLFGYYGRFNGGLLSIITYIVLYYGFVSLIKEGASEFITKLLKISLVSSFLVILWGLPGRFLSVDMTCWLFTGTRNVSCWTEQFNPAVRMFSTLGQPNWLGAYLAINFFIGLYFFLKEAFSTRKYLLLTTIYLLLNMSAILFTRSRSSYIALVIGGLAVGALLFSYFRGAAKKSKKAIIALLLVLFAAGVVFKTGVPGVDTFLTFSKNQKSQETSAPSTQVSQGEGGTESFSIRKIVWQGAWLLGLKYPLTGTGVETFAYSYYFTRLTRHNLTTEWDFLYNKAHNEFLNYFATTGFLGLGAYFIMIGTVLILFISKMRNKKNGLPADKRLLLTCLFASYLTILITNLFGFSTTTINMFFYLLPAFVLTLERREGEVNEYRSLKIKNQKIPKLILVMGYLYILIFLARYIAGDIYFARAKSYGRVLEYSKAHEYYHKALSTHYEHVYEDAFSYNSANLAYIALSDKDKTLSKDLIQLSQILNAKSIAASPKNVLYYKTQAKNNYLFYQIDPDKKYLTDGVDALKTAMNLAPTDPKLPYTRAIFYSLLEEEATKANEKTLYKLFALHDLKYALALKPDYRDAHLLRGQLLKKYGQPEEAKAVFQYILKHIDPNDEEAKNELGL